MRHVLAAAILLSGLAGAAPAHAVGCISGAVVGGVAGHYAGRHGLLGAAAGCALGHRQAVANKRAAQQARLQQQQARNAGVDRQQFNAPAPR